MRNQVSNLFRLPAFWIGTSICMAGVVSNLSNGQTDSPELLSPAAENELAKLMREGTRVENRSAICRSSGGRLMVDIAGLGKLLALENLAAQRILKAVLDDGEDVQWYVSGQITEYQGGNFLLLDRVSRGASK
jgi:hypothetical protein